MIKQKFPKIEIEKVLAIGNVIQVVTPHIAGIGKLVYLEASTLVLDPLDAEALALYTPAPSKDQIAALGNTNFDATIPTVPTTVIISLDDINLIFKLTPNQIINHDK